MAGRAAAAIGAHALKERPGKVYSAAVGAICLRCAARVGEKRTIPNGPEKRGLFSTRRNDHSKHAADQENASQEDASVYAPDSNRPA